MLRRSSSAAGSTADALPGTRSEASAFTCASQVQQRRRSTEACSVLQWGSAVLCLTQDRDTTARHAKTNSQGDTRSLKANSDL